MSEARAAPAIGRWALYWRLVRLHRPIGILLLLWPTLWGVLIASRGEPDGYLLFAFTLGTVLKVPA
jgi:4-hydroxybenzoate polyprenyltransferase